MNSDERAERLLGQLHQWAMEVVEYPREEREALISEIASRYYEDAVKNGLSASQATAWRDSVQEWLHQLVGVIETSGGAAGGHG